MELEDYLKENYSPTSIRSYRNTIRHFCSWMHPHPAQADYQNILDYLAYLRAEKRHPKTIRNHLFAVKIYFNYLLSTGQRTDHPCRYLYLKDQVNRQIAIEELYKKEELEDLYKNHRSKNKANQRRDEVLISLLIYQALTVLEISQLKVSDVDLEKGLIRIRENKKNRGRELSLKAVQIMLLHKYLMEDRVRYTDKKKGLLLLGEQGKPMWSGGISRILNQNRQGKKRMLAQKIRQSVIAHLLKAKNDVRIVQAFAGHRRSGSTEAYAQTGLEELKIAVEQKHPYQG